MPAPKADNILRLRISQNWLLHFTRKLNLAIQSRFPDSRIIAPSPLLIPTVQWEYEISLLCHSDRIAQDSHLIPSSVHYAENKQHFICSIWNYTDVIIALSIKIVNTILYVFTQVQNVRFF